MVEAVPSPETAFVMCEQERMLEPLSAWERRGSHADQIPSSPFGILTGYRMIPLLSSTGRALPKKRSLSQPVLRIWNDRLRVALSKRRHAFALD